MTNLQLGATLQRLGGLFRPSLSCSFCGRSADAVDRLVAGASAHICDACIGKCVVILEQHGGSQPAAPKTD